MLYNLTGKVTQGGTVALDPTLSLVNAAAQAKATGEAVKALNDGIEGHTNNKENPHGITKAQLGLGEVDNTSDLDKPVSNKQQAAIELAVTAAKNEMEVAVTYAKDTADEAKAAAENAQTAADNAQAAADNAQATADAPVTRSKLASDALFSPCVISDSRELTASDIGATIQNKWGVSATFTLTQAASASMPAGSTIAFLKLGPMAMDNYTVAIQTSGVRLGVTGDKYYPTDVTLKIADYMGEIALRKASNDGATGDFWVVIGNVEVVS